MIDVIIVGAGTGGLSVAKQLSKNQNVNLLIFDKGPLCATGDAYKFYESWDKSELELIRTTAVGGSSTVIAGNFLPSLVDELKEYGMDITLELDQLAEEIGIEIMPDSHVGPMTKILEKASRELGLNMQPMPKAIDSNKCIQCGKCAWGCPNDAKWSTLNYLDILEENNVKLIENEGIVSLIAENNKIKAVKSDKGETYFADIVILAAGGLVTPKLLRTVGIDAGNSLAVDPFVTIGGYYKNARQDHEIQMNKYIKLSDVVISPHTSQYLLPKIQETHPDATVDDILSLMVKVPDNTIGQVHGESISKFIDHEDSSKIAKGCGIAAAILVQAGADIKSISSTHVRGAHLIASAKIGEVVDKNLESKIKNLYVADGSVLPEAPGIPPVYTILALARHLGNYLNEKI